MSTRTRLVSACFCGAAFVLAYLFGNSYIDRLPNHDGYHLVAVDDTVGAGYRRPRHTVVIVVDGLSRTFAEAFTSTRRLRSEGQCRVMQVGPITVSRPVYAVLSTGLEQDRTGCRNNDETSPLRAQSIWQVARRQGLEVNGVSAVPWWRQLFTDGFIQYEVIPTIDDPFARAKIGDLTLVHPLYVDEAGHQHGAASPEYASAAQRANDAIMTFVDRFDLTQDLVVLTADHGHMSYGGHGATQREISEVITCYAGRGVARRAELGNMDSLSFAPSLAVLMGIPFPRHMRALEDDLDVIFDIADTSVLPADYVADRRAAVERFRTKNRDELGRWLGDGAPTWTSFYAKYARAQRVRLISGLAVLAVALGISFRQRRLGWRKSVEFAVWAGLTIGATLAVYALLRGSLDFTSINARLEFLRAGLGVSAAIAVVAAVSHRLVLSDYDRLVEDELTLIGLTAFTIVLHPIVYGWPLGFPLPGPGLLFFPFFAPMFLVMHATLGAVLCGAYFVTMRHKPSA